MYRIEEYIKELRDMLQDTGINYRIQEYITGIGYWVILQDTGIYYRIHKDIIHNTGIYYRIQGYITGYRNILQDTQGHNT